MLIGILLKTEPLYIQDVDDPTEAASNCFMAAGIYSLFVLGTSLCILKSDRRQRDLSGEWKVVTQASTTLPTTTTMNIIFSTPIRESQQHHTNYYRRG